MINKPHINSPKPDYGLDAPALIRTFFAVSLGASLLTIAVLVICFGTVWQWVAMVPGVVAVYASSMGCYMLYWSRVVKLNRRETLLDLHTWSGEECVLDVGCGRGLMLVAAAKRVPNGGAVGVDIWRETDQSDNTPEAATENARREGVVERVTVETADARSLPCPDAAFDVVVSHWVVHNIPSASDREKALSEMVRVLKPGGRLILADIQYHSIYAELLTRLGMAEVRIVDAGWLGRVSVVISLGSFHPLSVTAQKPA